MSGRGKHTTRYSSRSETDSCEKSVDQRLDEITKAISSLLTREYLDEKLTMLKDEICGEVKVWTDHLEERIKDLESENHDLKKTVEKLETRCEELEGCFSGKINDLEQHGRKDSIRIVGLQDKEKESVEECVEKVVGLLNDKLEVGLCKEDINIAHRLGTYRGSKPRNVIVKFTRRRTKHDILHKRRKLKNSGYVIFEDLTKTNLQILKDAYKLSCVQNTYSVDGKLFAVLQNGTKRRLYYDTPLEEGYLRNNANFAH